jgi:hypothetical protein
MALTEFRSGQGTTDLEVVKPQAKGSVTAQYPIDAKQKYTIENAQERAPGR